MLIYHKTNGTIYCTQVVMSFTGSDITHSKKVCWEEHKPMVSKLSNYGRVFVPLKSMNALMDRSGYNHYFKELEEN